MARREPYGTILRKTVLIKMYQRIKKNRDKRKIWVVHDFGQEHLRKYLETLVSLNLIELINGQYRLGRKENFRRGVKGYRLK